MNRVAMVILWAAPALALLAACDPFVNSCGDVPLVELQSGVYVSEAGAGIDDSSSPHAVGQKTLTLDRADDLVTIAYMDEEGREVVEMWGIGNIVDGY